MLAALSAAAAAAHGPRPAVVAPAGWELTFADLHAAAWCAAARFVRLGIGPGDVVAVALGPTPDQVVTMIGAALAGATPAALNAAWWPRDLRAAADALAPELIVAPTSVSNLLDDHHRVQVIEPASSRAELLDGAPLAASRAAAPTGLIGFTGGATGEPRMIEHGPEQVRRLALRAAAHGDAEALAALDPSTALGLSVLLGALAAGGAVHLLGPWSAAAALEQLSRRRFARLWATGPQLAELAGALADGSGPAGDVGALEVSGGALHERPAAELCRRLGAALVTRYSLSEAGGWAAARRWAPRPAGPAGSAGPGGPAGYDALLVGHAAEGVELRLGEPGAPVRPGEAQALWVRGPAVTRPQIHRAAAPEAPPAADEPGADGDGWTPTGDLACLTEAGLRLLGRRVDAFERGGRLVTPAEVEVALARHPDLLDVVVVPRPDPAEGAVGVAVTVPRDPENPPFLGDLAELLEAAVAAEARPAAQVIADALPLTPTGLVARRLLAYDERNR